MKWGAGGGAIASEISGAASPRLSKKTGHAELEESTWLAEALLKRGVGEDVIRSLRELWARDRSGSIGFADLACEVGVVSSRLLAELRAQHHGLLLADPEAVERAGTPQIRALQNSLKRVRAVLLKSSSKRILVGVVNPSQRIVEDLKRLIAQSLQISPGLFDGLHEVELRVISEADFKDAVEVRGDAIMALEEPRSRKSISDWIKAAIREEASDLHFVPRETSVEVKFRIDGRLWTRQLISNDLREEILASAKMFGGLDVGRKLEPLDGSVHFELGSRRFKLRFSSIPTQFGQQVVVRILDQNSMALPFSALGLSPRDNQALQEAMGLPQGLVFLVGPTGSGKSTTLASLISQLDGHAYSIRTLENPIEYRLSNAIQTEVSSELNFASGLRALLRQDPDYILVGETRDMETAGIAIEAGLTGHMCFSTLHGNDAIGGIIRLLDMGVESGPMLASCHLFVAQRLVRRLCKKCRRPSENEALLVRRHGLTPAEGERLWEPVGCPECRDGFKGRIGIYELRWLRDFEEIVLQGGPHLGSRCREKALKSGMSSMRDDGLAKALQGLTTVDEVLSQIVA